MTITITLIKSRIIDAQLFYDIRFNPETIAVSSDKTIPSYHEHYTWYIKNYMNEFYTIIYNNMPVGYVRVDNNNIISIGITPTYFKQGIGTLSLRQLLYMYKGKQLIAKIFETNKPSIKLFRKFPEIKLIILKQEDENISE